jgi:hypothetical protein
LKHEAAQRDREREMALRREVYLPLAETIAHAFAWLGTVTTRKLTEAEEAPELIRVTAGVAKVQLVGSIPTLTAVAAFQTALTQAYLQATIGRIPLSALKSEIASIDQRVARYGADRDQALELMKGFNLRGDTDTRLRKVINDQFEFAGKQVAQLLDEREEVNRKHSVLSLQLTQESVAQYIQTAKLLLPAIVAIRKELDLGLDEVGYAALVERNAAKQREVFSGFMKQLDQAVHSERNSQAAHDAED